MSFPVSLKLPFTKMIHLLDDSEKIRKNKESTCQNYQVFLFGLDDSTLSETWNRKGVSLISCPHAGQQSHLQDVVPFSQPGLVAA